MPDGTRPSRIQAPSGANRRPRLARDFSPVFGSGGWPLIDHLRYPLCRVLLACGACGWARDYSPERIVEGLRAKRIGGNQTLVASVARQVQWPCPGCGRMHWNSQLAYAPGTDLKEVERAARFIRS